MEALCVSSAEVSVSLLYSLLKLKNYSYLLFIYGATLYAHLNRVNSDGSVRVTSYNIKKELRFVESEGNRMESVFKRSPSLIMMVYLYVKQLYHS